MEEKMTYVHKNPNGNCTNRSYSIYTDGNEYVERDNWNPHEFGFDPWVYEQMKSFGWNMDYREIQNATFAVFIGENVVESLLPMEELQKLLPWIELV